MTRYICKQHRIELKDNFCTKCNRFKELWNTDIVQTFPNWFQAVAVGSLITLWAAYTRSFFLNGLKLEIMLRETNPYVVILEYFALTYCLFYFFKVVVKK